TLKEGNRAAPSSKRKTYTKTRTHANPPPHEHPKTPANKHIHRRVENKPETPGTGTKREPTPPGTRHKTPEHGVSRRVNTVGYPFWNMKRCAKTIRPAQPPAPHNHQSHHQQHIPKRMTAKQHENKKGRSPIGERPSEQRPTGNRSTGIIHQLWKPE
ncbi:MAG: hypothetical protein IIZ50_03705, partial [Bifidobacterium sp.]|nr:hypothetical protein [Bifidobacterium sp.]